MPLSPEVYAKLLGERIARYGSHVWLVNTGWTGGPYVVGSRMKIAHTRAMIHAALDDSLGSVQTVQDPFFGLHVPVSCPGIPPELLQTRATWKDASAYDTKARELAGKFAQNIAQFAGSLSTEIRAAGPH